jgi:predicted nicotinamide N-methyase
VTLRIARTANFNRLLDVAVADPKQAHMPYWAAIWPSGIVLAGMIVREPGALRGKRVLELGPGVGVTAVAAMYAGADLTVADYAPGSLTLTALNALDQVGHEPHSLLVNWRDPSPALFAAAGAGFAVVLAADVFYEQKDVKPLGTLLERIVAPGGEVWIADPGRDPIAGLLETLHRRGWRGRSEECASARSDPNYHTRDIVAVHRLRRPPG